MVAALIAGTAAVLYAEGFRYAANLSAHWFQKFPYWFLVFTPFCFLVGFWIVHFFSSEASGSGIPQVMAANEMDHGADTPKIHALLSLKTALVKVISSLFCILGGGAIGREGPTIQIAASIFHFVGKRFQRFWPQKLNHHALIVSGGAAGISAAFNTPLGGIVYAIEELASEHFNHFRMTVILAVIVAGLVAQAISGPYLYLGFPFLRGVTIAIIPSALLVGAVAGLGGAFFGKVLFALARWRRGISGFWRLSFITLGLGFAFAVLSLVLTRTTMGPGTALMEELLFRKGAVADFAEVGARFLGPLVSYLSGAAGGIFAPSLAAGAAIGSKLAFLVGSEHANLLVLLGMIGFLTGVTRAPLTAFVLVLEMTDRHSAIFPMMLSALTAYGLARLVDSRSFYEHMKELYLK